MNDNIIMVVMQRLYEVGYYAMITYQNFRFKTMLSFPVEVLSHINKNHNEISMHLYDVTNWIFMKLKECNIRYPDETIVGYINIQLRWDIYGKQFIIIINKNTITLEGCFSPIEMELDSEAILIVI